MTPMTYTKKQILIISNNKCLNSNLCEALELLGQIAYSTTSADDGYSYLDNTDISTVILASETGGVPGLESLHKIREHYSKDIRIIGMAIKQDPHLEDFFLRDGANAFFYIPQELRALIDSAIFFNYPEREDAHDERRKEYRMRVGGRLKIDNSITSEIKDISSGGVRILLDKPSDIINENLSCDIELNTGRRIKTDAQLRWRRPDASWNGGAELGLEFDKAIKLNGNN